MAAPHVEIRPAVPEDREAILDLGVRALGWQSDDRERELFAWKHERNPFGPSLSWVAAAGGRVVGFRTFMRWELRRGQETLRLARAVDTATDPEFQRRGIFRRLTLGALPDLAAAGIDGVLNTPNTLSLPGYLSMGWSVLGRLPLAVAPRSPVSLWPMARSRGPAERWSEPVMVGKPAAAALAQLPGVPEGASPGCWTTPRTAAYLGWRYCLGSLDYRAIAVRGGVCVFRVRRRGASVEVALCEWLSAESDPRAVRRLTRAAGDYILGIGLSFGRHGALPLPFQGPVLAWRPLAEKPPLPLRDLSLTLGDVELF